MRARRARARAAHLDVSDRKEIVVLPVARGGDEAHLMLDRLYGRYESLLLCESAERDALRGGGGDELLARGPVELVADERERLQLAAAEKAARLLDELDEACQAIIDREEGVRGGRAAAGTARVRSPSSGVPGTHIASSWQPLKLTTCCSSERFLIASVPPSAACPGNDDARRRGVSEQEAQAAAGTTAGVRSSVWYATLVMASSTAAKPIVEVMKASILSLSFLRRVCASMTLTGFAASSFGRLSAWPTSTT